ncbi:Seipin family [Cinara cedri]|uniref:Seipin n=1 Tax=Cinara cedri TaxID=506608 RepID=A0A5E4N3C5_9HEMI|nr:Seipin family [Cinara cedri]
MNPVISLVLKTLGFTGLKKIANEKFDKAINLAKDGMSNVQDTTYKGGLFSMIIITIIWISIFLYIAFYYAYMPSLILNRPIHMQFKNCYSNKQLCDYPSAHVKLTKNHQLLMIGQKYKMIVNMDLPESPVNEKIGMFMLCIRLNDKYGYLVSSTCRSNRLKYKSSLFHIIYTIFMAPFYLAGLSGENQLIQFEMYTEFEEDQLHPVTDIYFELLDYDIQIYSANINIIANLSGLRYLMFHWPILSAILGIGSNLLFVFFVFSMSWRHIYGAEIYRSEPNDLLDLCEVFDDYVTDQENESNDSCNTSFS